MTPRPRMSPALVWGWLLSTVCVPVFWLYHRIMLARALSDPDAEAALDLLTWGARVEWVISAALWISILVGLWATAKARDASILRQVTVLYAAQLLVDALAYGALLSGLLVFDSAWLDFSPFVRSVLGMSGGAFLLLYVYREGGRGLALVLPILAHLAMIAGMLVSEFADSSPDALAYAALAVGLFYWLAWLAVPREILSLEAAPEPAEPARP